MIWSETSPYQRGGRRCPWDAEQTHESTGETFWRKLYEVAESIARE
jgi:uncharacterized protein YabN with tetrapyrrole methylase and pyrophosphatase domain